MKKVNSYYISVEGENKKWYFEHLQHLINNSTLLHQNIHTTLLYVMLRHIQ